MVRLNKNVCSGFAAIVMGLNSAITANALDSNTITVFAGPQSLSPSKTISVTVQTPQRDGNFSDNPKVELTYSSDGILETLVGTATHGLLSFDVAAQDRAGIMTFSAKALGHTSPEALVTVVPGPPKNLPLQIKASGPAGMIVISSAVITDIRGNTVSDQSLVDLQWIDETGLIKSQNVQLFNGEVYLDVKCPSKFSGYLKIQALLKTVQFLSSDISTLCSVKKG